MLAKVMADVLACLVFISFLAMGGVEGATDPECDPFLSPDLPYWCNLAPTSTPVPPTATPTPPCGLAVPDQASNPGLMRDCMVLLAMKDTLQGTATLNWSVDTSITNWDGVTVGGARRRTD